MTENTSPARCTEEEWRLARDAGLPFFTTADEIAIHKFAEAVRALAAPLSQAVPEGVLTIAREALQAVTFTDRTAMNDKGAAEIPFCTLRKCADAISAIDSFSAAAPEAAVAKVWMKDGEIQKAATYMPGLPDGEHELYAGPQPQAVTEDARDGERKGGDRG